MYFWKAHPTAAHRRACNSLVTTFDLLCASRAEKALRWTKHKHYTCADKRGPMLAKKLNSVEKPHRPVRLRTQAGGGLTSIPLQILSVFSEFLSTLYAKPGPFPLHQAKQFFHALNLPKLPEGSYDAINANISEEFSKQLNS